jgi:alpha-L-fucosidase
MTMNGTWGYRTSDTNWKSASILIRNLCDIASKGGNYLLNVGPKADGSFPESSVRLLGEIGNWMKVNGESIYGTQSANINQPSWGRITRKKGNNGSEALYLQVFEWPNNRKLMIPIYANKGIIVNALVGNQSLPFQIKDNQLIIDVPSKALDNWVTVIRVTVE